MEELRLRNNPVKSFSMSGKVLGKHSFSILSSILKEFKPVYKDNRFRRIIGLGLVNFLSLLFLLSWSDTTNSLGLLSYTYLIFFDALCLCICALSVWVEQKKPNTHYTFGYERFEVLAVFVSTTFIFISSIFIIRKSIWRYFQMGGSKNEHTGLLIPGAVIAFVCHMLVTFCMKNKGLNLVICASDSSWLQNWMSFFSQSLSHIFPGISSSTKPRINPLTLLGIAAGGILVLDVFLSDVLMYYIVDAVAGILISLLTSVTMYPLSAYTGKILLQGTPPHIKDLLDKCLREVSTLDGVLEFRNERFWLLGFDKIVGTVHVRIRRDANEQIVLCHLLNKLSSLVTDITIQIFKDEWTWNSGSRQILTEHYVKFPPVSVPYVIPTSTTLTSGVKDVSLIPSVSFKGPYMSTYSDAADSKSYEPKKSPGSYATIPLPPSLSSSHTPKSSSAQDYSIDMTPASNPVQTHSSYDAGPQSSRLASYSPQSSSSTSKYHRELTINPLGTSRPDYIKYKS